MLEVHSYAVVVEIRIRAVLPEPFFPAQLYRDVTQRLSERIAAGIAAVFRANIALGIFCALVFRLFFDVLIVLFGTAHVYRYFDFALCAFGFPMLVFREFRRFHVIAFDGVIIQPIERLNGIPAVNVGKHVRHLRGFEHYEVHNLVREIFPFALRDYSVVHGVIDYRIQDLVRNGQRVQLVGVDFVLLVRRQFQFVQNQVAGIAQVQLVQKEIALRIIQQVLHVLINHHSYICLL